MMAQLLPHPFLDLGHGNSLLAFLAGHNEGRNNLTIPPVWDTHDGYVQDVGVREETVLDFKRMDILSTTNDEVLDAARNSDVSIR